MRGKIAKTALIIICIVVSLAAGRLAARLWVAAKYRDNAQGGPELVLHETNRDFGAVPQGQKLRARFRVENRGAKRLVISRYVKPCCDKPGFREDLIIRAGEQRFLQIEVDTSQWAGSVAKTISYKTNDARHPSFDLTIRATVNTHTAKAVESSPKNSL